MMWFWWFMLVCNLLIPAAMIAAGRLMWKHPPKDINGIVGYRTPRSMKNQDTWKFAHDYCGRLWWKIGWILLLVSAIPLIPVYSSTDQVIGIVGGVLEVVQLAVLILSIIPTERALKRKFDEDGELR